MTKTVADRGIPRRTATRSLENSGAESEGLRFRRKPDSVPMIADGR
jgi:hypothetical protein